MARRFVMLDRDGVVIFEREYLRHPSQVELIPRAAMGLRLLQSLGLGLVVITNQSGIARGFFTVDDLNCIHSRMADLLGEEDVRLDGVYACPHRPEDECGCRKPRTGLVEQASKELGFNPEDGFVIGDKAIDIELGRRVGATTILVRTGYGAAFAADPAVRAGFIADDLWDAAVLIERLVSEASPSIAPSGVPDNKQWSAKYDH